MGKPTDFIQGTLDLILLKILALEPLHGWAISHRLPAMSGRVLKVSQGALYPALHRLEVGGWIRTEWKVTENNRRAKFYSLTASGRTALKQLSADWNRLSNAVSQLLRLKEAKV